MLNDTLRVPRTDAIYNMHGYLTKVPVGAIIPFISEYCPEDGTVIDIFAGSGMTALAARMCGRNSIVSDISTLGKHIGEGYLTKVSANNYVETANKIISESKSEVGSLYNTVRQSDSSKIELIRTVWSFVYECSSCEKDFVYYDALKDADWLSSKLACPHCSSPFQKKGSKVTGEVPVLTAVNGENKRQTEQKINKLDLENIRKAEKTDILAKIPSNKITPDREMYKRSALEKWGLTETRLFFSERNATILFDLWSRINSVEDKNIRKKLLFTFTAILPRASKRYQWSHKAPLNAANQNYYIAPVFYEWNIYDLFLRKVNACLKSDNLLNEGISSRGLQKYITSSASELKHLEDNSIDYVFTDPPFGSNIFYADMNLFQEAWIGKETAYSQEAVMRTTGGKGLKEKSAERYKELLTKSFKEAYRVLKEGGKCSIVFGNSKGAIWSIAQKAIRDAGFCTAPVRVTILDKGQRSVKGLNSGREKVSTLDLIVTVEKSNSPATHLKVSEPKEIIKKTLDSIDLSDTMTASHIYAEVLRQSIASSICMAEIDLHDILEDLASRGIKIDPETGYLSFQ